MPRAVALSTLKKRARSCTLCEDELENGVRPVFQVSATARVLIVGQAPGSRVHKTGIPFDDPSGVRLREWMGIDADTFYDETRIALLPMGFCYPGKGKSGDLPPVPRCAQTWRQPFLDAMPDVKLTLVIGQYAMAWHLDAQEKTLTDTVRAWKKFGTAIIPLPHPSPRNNIWLRKNPWFESEVIPVLRRRVKKSLK